MQSFHGIRLNSIGEIDFQFKDYFFRKSLSYFVIFSESKSPPQPTVTAPTLRQYLQIIK
jgi:hypothetical protein